MKITTILFDLDGTLLPMEQETFIKSYFGGISARLARHGYAPQTLIKTIWTGTEAMIRNDGAKRNEEVFWDVAAGLCGESIRADEPHFNAFYVEDFDKVQTSCGYQEKAAKTVAWLKEKGYRLALATNPVFPAIATRKRIAWAGLNADDFQLITTYENSRRCKPNPAYYQDVLDELGVCAEECLMVGNDVTEDMVAQTLGMRVFLLTDCLINKNNADISAFPNGNFDDLAAFLEQINEE